jgi:hypothetical protein
MRLGPPKTSERHYAGAVYGTILVMALLAIEPETESAWEVAAALAATMFAFWLAHVYAHSVAARLHEAERLSWSHVRAQMAIEWPMVESSLPALAALLLAAAGAFETDTAITLGLVFGMLQLFGWGLYIGLGQGLTPWRSAFIGAVDCSFGLVIVLIETLVH